MRKALISVLLVLLMPLLVGCYWFNFKVFRADLEDIKIYTLDDEEIVGTWVMDYEVDEYFYDQQLSFKQITKVNSPAPIREYYQIESDEPISFIIEFRMKMLEKYTFDTIQIKSIISDTDYKFMLDDDGVTCDVDERIVVVRFIMEELSESEILYIESITCLEKESDGFIYVNQKKTTRPGGIEGIFFKLSE